MAKNIRKLFAEVEKNLKAIDEVYRFRQIIERLSNFYIGYHYVRQFGEQTAKCPNTNNEGKT